MTECKDCKHKNKPGVQEPCWSCDEEPARPKKNWEPENVTKPEPKKDGDK